MNGISSALQKGQWKSCLRFDSACFTNTGFSHFSRFIVSPKPLLPCQSFAGQYEQASLIVQEQSLFKNSRVATVTYAKVWLVYPSCSVSLPTSTKPPITHYAYK